jgi:hypothetical protein
VGRSRRLGQVTINPFRLKRKPLRHCLVITWTEVSWVCSSVITSEDIALTVQTAYWPRQSPHRIILGTVLTRINLRPSSSFVLSCSSCDQGINPGADSAISAAQGRSRRPAVTVPPRRSFRSDLAHPGPPSPFNPGSFSGPA